MRVYLEVLGPGGEVRSAHTLDAPVVSVGGADDDGIYVAGLPEHALEVHVQPGRVAVRTASQEVPVREATTFRLTDAVALHITPQRTEAGGCPRCGAVLHDRSAGGAYRAIARRERTCARCGTSVIDLEDAARTVGAFADLSRNDWVAVIVPLRCPRCTTTMHRAVFRTARGEAEVERCVRCGVVVLDATDRTRLTGEEHAT